MISQILKYLRFLIQTIFPFKCEAAHIQDLIDSVIKDDRWFYSFNAIESLRRSLLKNKEEIAIIDYGAGSRQRTHKRITIHTLAATSLSYPYQCRVMFRLVEFLEAKTVIELGTSLGISTCYLASANKDTKVYTLEGNPSSLQVAKHLFKTLKLQNILTVPGPFSETLENTIKGLESIDLSFIDGHHNEEATIDYFEQIAMHCHTHSCIIVDDIYWSAGMTRAWEKIQADQKTTFTVDLFFCGLVFFDPSYLKETSAQHIKVRPDRLLFHL